jgi:hypothetical protein
LVSYSIARDINLKLNDIFKEYTNDNFEFNKTKTTIHLYKTGQDLISRSIAKRIVRGFDNFEIIMLDFKKVDTVGQGFADEIFRVWKAQNPAKKLEYINANDNIEFMIKRAMK